MDTNSSKLRDNPVIWESRLHTAEELEAEADHLEHPGLRSKTPIRQAS
jgi:hypothetical protein